MGGRLGVHGGAHRGRLLAIAGAVEALLVAVSVIEPLRRAARGRARPATCSSSCWAAGMGAQNAAARRLAVPDLTTTVLTLTITGMFADGRMAGGEGSRVGRRLLPPLAMFVGGLGGALLVVHASDWLSIAVALAVLVLVAADGRSRRSHRTPWSRGAERLRPSHA